MLKPYLVCYSVIVENYLYYLILLLFKAIDALVTE